MAIVTWIIGLALSIKVVIQFCKDFTDYESFWKKVADCLTVLAVLTISSGLGVLFLQVSQLSK